MADDEWIVDTARRCLKSNPYEAKAWLITARTLFPRNFAIQFEAYSIEKANGNKTEAAKLLEEMFANFPQEPVLWNEVHGFSEALQVDSSVEQTYFLRDLFAALPTTLQCHLLLRIADGSKDVLEQCRLMLLVLQRYPERIPEEGIKLIDTLLTTEKHMHTASPVNPYRKYLVCDVLPLVLSVPLPEVQYKQLVRWMQKSIEFFIMYITQPGSGDSPAVLSPDVMSPTSKKFAGFRRMSIPGLSEKESTICQPWEKLFHIVKLTAGHLGWSAGDLFMHSSRESQWQAIYGVHQSAADPSTVQKQIVHLTTLLFLHCLYHYASRIDTQQFSGSASSQHPPLVMIEGFKAGPGGTCSPLRRPSIPKLIIRPRSKKARLENSAPPVHASKRITGAQDIIDSFKTALKCWELLHMQEFEKEFNKLLQAWHAASWSWLKSFEIDMLIYQGHFREAVNLLQMQRAANKASGTTSVRSDLQTACCYYCLGNFSKASECVLAVVTALPTGSEPAPQDINLIGSGRQVQLLTCSEAEVLPYCIHLMITCFREKAFKQFAPDDMSLGHMIVLLQYDWPRYEQLFAEVLRKIQKLGSFTYNLFFNYIINIDVLEEFAFLRIMDSGRISLDILPTSTKTLAQQRTVTRGVNKGVKEDFKVAMEKQVARSSENLETVIRQFLLNEKELLQQNLM